MSRVPWNFGDGPVWSGCLTWSLCMTGVTVLVMRVECDTNAARCRWPLTRRNCLAASCIPAAHQRRAICPSRQRFTLVE